MIDFFTSIDVTSRLAPGQARKVLSAIFHHDPCFVSFTKHAREQMAARNLKTGDVLNILKAGWITDDPEFVNSSYRYRVSTSKITVVIAFRKPFYVVVVTAWRE